jgi:UrcA family protein
MNAVIASIRFDTLRKTLPIAFATCLLAAIGARAQASDPEEIIVTGPRVTIVGHDMMEFGVPIKQTTASASVEVDTRTLATNSGVAQLNKDVRHAAFLACAAADPLTAVDQTCIRDATKSAQPQVAALIARARSEANG